MSTDANTNATTDRPPHVDRVVVGIDGSTAAERALTWAIAETERRGGTLDVVTVWEVPYRWAEGFNQMWAEDQDYFAAAAVEQARGWVDHALGGKPHPDWLTVHAVEGIAAQVLLARAEHADLLVVGSRGRGGFSSLLLGSVSTACAHHAPCPMVIVPADRDEVPAT